MRELQLRAVRNGAIATLAFLTLGLVVQLHRGLTLDHILNITTFSYIAFTSVYWWSLPANAENMLKLPKNRYSVALVVGASVAFLAALVFDMLVGGSVHVTDWQQWLYLAWAACLGALFANLVANVRHASLS